MAILNAQHTTKSLVEGLSFFREFDKSEITSLGLNETHELILTKRSLNPIINIYAKFKTSTLTQSSLSLGEWSFFENGGSDLFLFNGNDAKFKFSEDGSLNVQNNVVAITDLSDATKGDNGSSNQGVESDSNVVFTEIDNFIKIDSSLLDVTLVDDTKIIIKFPFAVDYRISVK